MPAASLLFIPFDGSRETSLNASEAAKLPTIENPVLETRLSELLEQRKIKGLFMLTEKGVLFRGDNRDGLAVSRIVDELPNLAPTARSNNVVSYRAANDDADKRHIVADFGGAAQRFKVASLRQPFSAAANDEEISFKRFTKPSINGSAQAYRALAA
ncbi:MAG: hypothetical protein DI551_01105 [Micavibrio aeruginosavorus]|uniref:Uncharacterized protein n=1 Tax=Micavibrio aeruginosavorus TaxID=349221 RepID=A0A2W5N5D7_9BACT|nr:MAG: hypothetical protein DI551_01105 [Micavibrio aeruginosavorus]